MDIQMTVRQGICEVTLSGKFTFNDHLQFREVLQQLPDPQVQQMVFRLQQVEFVDSAALGMLLLALDESRKNHKKLVLTGASGQVDKMFQMARFNTLFDLM